MKSDKWNFHTTMLINPELPLLGSSLTIVIIQLLISLATKISYKRKHSRILNIYLILTILTNKKILNILKVSGFKILHNHLI